MGELIAVDAEMVRARAVLATARVRMRSYREANAGAIDRDLQRRLRDALRQVRWLESVAA